MRFWFRRRDPDPIDPTSPAGLYEQHQAGVSYRKLARAYGIPLGTVKSRISREVRKRASL